MKENGLLFVVPIYEGQKTGFFLDQRDNRLLLKHYSKNRKVLNTFCYTGGFSVYALSGDAALVHSVDSSKKAMELIKGSIDKSAFYADKGLNDINDYLVSQQSAKYKIKR